MITYNEDMTQVLNDYDLRDGYLVQKKIQVDEIPAQPEQKAEYSYSDWIETTNGGRYREEILVKPYKPAVPAQPIYDTVQVFIPYKSPEEKRKAYELRVEELIRQRYSMSEEIAILRKKDDPEKQAEHDAWYDFCEECKKAARSEYGY